MDSDKKLIRRMKAKYVRVKKMGEKWNTYLQIDHQGFSVVEQTTKKRAEFFGKMLAIACWCVCQSRCVTNSQNAQEPTDRGGKKQTRNNCSLFPVGRQKGEEMAVLIVKKPGSIPFTKRPTGSMRELILEAQAKHDLSTEMIVAWVDNHGQIQVESVQGTLNGHSALPVKCVRE
jgi:hypothetical protein